MSDQDLRRARLKAALLENGETEDQAEALAGVATFLNRLSDPAPNLERQAALRALLNPHPPTPSPTRFAGERGSAWTLMRAQLRVVQGEIWLASLFVMALGAVVTALLYAPGQTLPLVLIAPLVAAFGVAFIYGEEADPPLELLLTTLTSPRTVLLARLALVFGFDLLLGVGVSALLFIADPQFAASGLTLWGMVTAWLAPMTFLAMLALLSSMIFRDALTGAAVSLFLWIGVCVAHVVSGWENALIRLPDLLASGAHPLLWALALVCGAAALWFAGREEHWVRNGG